MGYVRAALPYLPEEGVEAFVGFLTSEETMADISFHIGTKDLIMAEVSVKILWAEATRRRTTNIFKLLLGLGNFKRSSIRRQLPTFLWIKLPPLLLSSRPRSLDKRTCLARISRA